MHSGKLCELNSDMITKSISIPRIENLLLCQHPELAIQELDAFGVRDIIDSVNWADKFPYRPFATFVAGHDGKNLWIDFLVRSNSLRAENSTDHSPVSQDSCVEVFIEPYLGGEYWNFEFNCIGAATVSHRLTRPEPTRLTADELALIVRLPSSGTMPFGEIKGLFTWNLLVKIPLSLMGVDASAGPVEMRGNFYKCAGASTEPHYMSWNAINTPKPDFHRPEFFGKIILE